MGKNISLQKNEVFVDFKSAESSVETEKGALKFNQNYQSKQRSLKPSELSQT